MTKSEFKAMREEELETFKRSKFIVHCVYRDELDKDDPIVFDVHSHGLFAAYGVLDFQLLIYDGMNITQKEAIDIIFSLCEKIKQLDRKNDIFHHPGESHNFPEIYKQGMSFIACNSRDEPGDGHRFSYRVCLNDPNGNPPYTIGCDPSYKSQISREEMLQNDRMIHPINPWFHE